MLRSSVSTVLAALLVLSSACSKDPATPEYWEKLLKGQRRGQDRARVLEEMRDSGHLTLAMLPLLTRHFGEEKRYDARAVVARHLGQLGDPSAVTPLVDGIDWSAGPGADKLNREIAAALGKLGQPAATPHLLRLIKVKDGFVRVEAIDALGAIGAEEAVEPLIAIAGDDTDEPFVSKRAVEALGDIGDERAVPVLIQRMFKPHARGQQLYGESSFALFQIGAPATAPLMRILSGEDRVLRRWAAQQGIEEEALFAKSAQVLGDLGERSAVPALVRRLAAKGRDPDVEVLVKITVADALGRLRAKEASRELAKLVSDERPQARERYAWALVRIGDSAAAPALLAAAEKGYWDAREIALSSATLLGGPELADAVTRLATEEPARLAAECEEDPYSGGCDRLEATAKQRQEQMAAFGKALAAAGECAQDGACWAKKLGDEEAHVRARAALELGRGGHVAQVGALAAVLGEKDIPARQAAVQALDWLIDSDAKAKAQTVPARAKIEALLQEERGSTSYVRVNEDLRRLLVKLGRGAG